jgi:hypothetical protein
MTMTIMATHFAIVLGAWRLRIRIDLDEPREDMVDSGTLADDRAQSAAAARNGTRAAASTASPWN